MDGSAKALSVNGDCGDWVSTTGEERDTEVFFDEVKEFRSAVERLNYLGQDSPDVQLPAKVLSSEMANPTTGVGEDCRRSFGFWLVESELYGDPFGSPWRRRSS